MCRLERMHRQARHVLHARCARASGASGAGVGLSCSACSRSLLLLRFLEGHASRRRSGCPCPCRARADGSRALRRRSGPRAWRSAPLITISVCVGVSHLDAGGHVLDHRVRETDLQVRASCPGPGARKPTPTSVSFFSKPLDDAVDHVVDQRAHRAAHRIGLARDSLAGANVDLAVFVRDRAPGAFSGRVSVPLLPLTVILSALTCTSTPLGTSIGIFPTRDMFDSPPAVRRRRPSTSPPTPAWRAPCGRSSRPWAW